MVQLRSFYEGHVGHKLVVESGSLPSPAYLLAGWDWELVPCSQNSLFFLCKMRMLRSRPLQREAFFFFFKLGKQTGFSVGIELESFPDSEEHLEV